MNTVVIKGQAPSIKVLKNGQVIEVIRSQARLEKRIRQEGWTVNTKSSRPAVPQDVHPSVLAKQIRKEGESWPEAFRRAVKLQREA